MFVFEKDDLVRRYKVPVTNNQRHGTAAKVVNFLFRFSKRVVDGGVIPNGTLVVVDI